MRSVLLKRVDVTDRPAGMGADAVERDLQRLVDVACFVRAHRDVLHELHDRRLFIEPLDQMRGLQRHCRLVRKRDHEELVLLTEEPLAGGLREIQRPNEVCLLKDRHTEEGSHRHVSERKPDGAGIALQNLETDRRLLLQHGAEHPFAQGQVRHRVELRVRQAGVHELGDLTVVEGHGCAVARGREQAREVDGALQDRRCAQLRRDGNEGIEQQLQRRCSLVTKRRPHVRRIAHGSPVDPRTHHGFDRPGTQALAFSTAPGGGTLDGFQVTIYRERIQQFTIGGLRWVAGEKETTTTITASASGDPRHTFAA